MLDWIGFYCVLEKQLLIFNVPQNVLLILCAAEIFHLNYPIYRAIIKGLRLIGDNPA